MSAYGRLTVSFEPVVRGFNVRIMAEGRFAETDDLSEDGLHSCVRLMFKLVSSRLAELEPLLKLEHGLYLRTPPGVETFKDFNYAELVVRGYCRLHTVPRAIYQRGERT